MIPDNIELINGFTIRSKPSYTYRLYAEKERIKGKTDNRDAMEQAIYKILGTERYDYLIYSHKYGIELKDLIGEQTSYVKAVLPSRISQALMQDNRINAVNDFEIDVIDRNTVVCSFSVETEFGDFKVSKEVSY